MFDAQQNQTETLSMHKERNAAVTISMFELNIILCVVLPYLTDKLWRTFRDQR